MILVRKSILFSIIFIVLGALILYQCNTSKTTSEKISPYLNLHDSVKYVGIETCKSCHLEIYNTYMQTGMGRSFALATPQKSDALFDKHAIVFDTINNFYYKPYFSNDSLLITEFRLEGKDTVHKRTEHVNYIIGSGNHTNSHLVNFNGFIYQAPITFYTQKQKWDMAPGFEKGFNSRFDRIIAHECMTCHNAMPESVKGSENLYKSVPNGIDCERCHGKGSLHVKEKLAGNIVDTSKTPDYTIVNPRRLSKNLQMSLCQRCHLQGASVLADGKNFDDFKPGMELSSVCNVFLPVFESKKNNFLMASQAERLRLSKCYLESEMTCITCHNPHVSVKQTSKKLFNSKCENCHNEKPEIICTVPISQRQKNNNNCNACHMPQSPSIDIPHVSIHDHFIRKNNLESGNQLGLEEIEKIQKFVELKCYTTDKPNDLLKAKGFLAFYEKFSTKKIYLDSAGYYLSIEKNENLKFNTLIHYYFLNKNFKDIINLAETSSKIDKNDSWTLYRIGEAFYNNQEYLKALNWFEKAVVISPNNLDFINKVASSYFNLGNMNKAKLYFEKITVAQPKFKVAYCNLGYIYMSEGHIEKAKKYLDIALLLDPDYELALMNMAQWYFQQKQLVNCKKVLSSIIVKHPENKKAKQLLQTLKPI